MKRITIYILAALSVLCLFSCGNSKENKNDLSVLFDNKEQEVQQAGNSTNEEIKKDETKENPGNTTEKDNTQDKSEETMQSTGDNAESTKPEVPYNHSDTEKQLIVSRYIEAEDFYYTILYQRFELDSYDIISKTVNGYPTEYRRVIYYDVNTLESLKNLYRQYFTEDFTDSVDFSSFTEKNGKLYCAETQSAASQAGIKYIYTASSIDENNAYITRKRTDGSRAQKISAIKENGEWYFDGVAIG